MPEVRQRKSHQTTLTKEEVNELAEKLKTLARIISELCLPAEMEAAKKNIELYPDEPNWLAGAKDEALQVCNESLKTANTLLTTNPTQEVMQKSNEVLLKAIDQALFLGKDPESLTKFLPDEVLQTGRLPLEEMEPPGGFG